MKEAFTCIWNISKEDCLPNHTDDRTACGLSTHLQSLSDDGFSSCCCGWEIACFVTDRCNKPRLYIHSAETKALGCRTWSDWSHVLQKAQFVPKEQSSEFLYFVLSLLRLFFFFLFSFILGFCGLTKKLVSEHKILKVCTLWSDYLGFFLFPFFFWGFFGLTKNIVSEA